MTWEVLLQHLVSSGQAAKYRSACRTCPDFQCAVYATSQDFQPRYWCAQAEEPFLEEISVLRLIPNFESQVSDTFSLSTYHAHVATLSSS